MKHIIPLSLIVTILLASCQMQTINQSAETTYSMNGVIQKGPFQLGSGVTVQEVDKDLNPTGRMYSTTTNNDFGSFSLSSKFSSQYVEVTGEGYYFNECENVTANAKLTLRSFGDLSLGKPLNLNVLTTIVHGRIRKLVDEGKSFITARDQAEQELLSLLGFSSLAGLHFYDFNLTSGRDDAALLLAVSATLQKGRSVSALSQIIADLVADFSDDGSISNTSLITNIRTSALALSVPAVVSNLKTYFSNRGQSVEIPDFTGYRSILATAGGILADPVFDLVSGVYIEEKTLKISAPSGAEIRYTLDGSTPTAESNLYSNPIVLSVGSTITVKAVAVLNNVVSKVTTATFAMRNGKYTNQYVDPIPGHYILYDFYGYNSSNGPLASYKMAAVIQNAKEANQYHTSVSLSGNVGGYSYVPYPPTGFSFGSNSYGSASGMPNAGFFYFFMIQLPDIVVSESKYTSAEGIEYTPKFLDSWGNFTDVIQLDYDSRNFYANGLGTICSDLQGVGKIIFSKGRGLVHFELNHDSASSSFNGKKEYFTYSEHGIAPLITFRGSLKKLGEPAIGHTITPLIRTAALPTEAYANIAFDPSFEMKQYAVKGTYYNFRIYKTDTMSYVNRFKVLIPSDSTIVELNDISL